MNRRARIALVSLLVFGIAGLTLGLAYDPDARLQGWVRGEPFYAGRSATAWERELRSPDENTAVAALSALVEGKEQSAPLCGWLLTHSEDANARSRAGDALKKMGKSAAPAASDLVSALGDSDPLVRGVAIRTVGELQPDLPGAVPGLIACFPDSDAIRAVASYKQSAAAAVPRLIELAGSDDSNVRRQSVRALGKIGPPALDSLPTLTALTGKDPVAGVREQSAEAIGELGPIAAEGIPALTQALKDPDAKVRRDAVRSLGQMGPVAKNALPEVRALTGDPEAIVREAAKKAARLIDPSAKS